MGVGLHSNAKAVKLEFIGISSIKQKNAHQPSSVESKDNSDTSLVLPEQSAQAGDDEQQRYQKFSDLLPQNRNKGSRTRDLIRLSRVTVDSLALRSPPVCRSDSQMSYFNNR